MTDRCRSCQAEIVFVKTAKTGASMPLDAKPKRMIVLVAQIDDDDAAGVVILAGTGAPPEHARAISVPVYTPHHATCPDGRQWTGGDRPKIAATEPTVVPAMVWTELEGSGILVRLPASPGATLVEWREKP